jgi:hypothetical protein
LVKKFPSVTELRGCASSLLKEGDHFEDLGIAGRIMLKMDHKEI